VLKQRTRNPFERNACGPWCVAFLTGKSLAQIQYKKLKIGGNPYKGTTPAQMKKLVLPHKPCTNSDTSFLHLELVEHGSHWLLKMGSKVIDPLKRYPKKYKCPIMILYNYPFK